MTNLVATGTGVNTRISPDKAVSGGFIPADPAVAGLVALGSGKMISPDPATAATQIAANITVIP